MKLGILSNEYLAHTGTKFEVNLRSVQVTMTSQLQERGQSPANLTKSKFSEYMYV